MITDNAAAPLTPPHAVVPHGQMKGDIAEHSVTPPADDQTDGALKPPTIEKLKKMFDEARQLTNEARDEQEKDQDYYDTHGQATPEVRHILDERKQPLVIDNRIAPAIDGILGVMESGKTDPRAYPRNPQGQQAADTATKMLRFIADKTRWNKTRMDCASDYLIHGITAAIVEFDGRDISINRGRWETFFYDPKSRDADFRDAKYLGFASWMYADEVAANPEWAERVKTMGDLTTTTDETAVESTWDDKPENRITWIDRRRNRVLVVEIYYRSVEGWLRAVYCAAGTLEFDYSPYKDVRTGETRCPIEAQSFKVDRKNQRYGPIRAMRYMQDEVNSRRSRGMHLLNSRQVQQTDMSAPIVDSEIVRKEAARADGVIPMGWQAVQATDMANGNLQMLAEAKESLQRMVPVAIAQDLREGSAASGRARQVAQQAGLTQFGRGFGQFADFEERVYRQMWMCAQQFKTAPEWIRVTDNPQAVEFLQINEVTGYQPTIAPGPGGQPTITQQPIVQNRPAEMDMDIIISTTPDTVALEQEVFESVMQLLQSGIDPLSPVFEVVLELAPLPDKTRLLERVKALKDQIAQQQAQQMQQQAEAQARAQQLMEAEQAANIENKQAQTEKTRVETVGKQIGNEKEALSALQPTHLQRDDLQGA